MKEAVKVALRVRPLNQREKDLQSEVIVTNQNNKLSIKKDNNSKQFIFDYVFGMDTSQQTIYENSVFSLIENVLQGFNGTIFAYGQTGAGKTHTMVGNYTHPEIKGIIPRTFQHIITAIQTSQDRKFVLRASFIQIYNEEIIDLLQQNRNMSKKNLKQNPNTGIYIHQLKMIPVKSINEMFKVLDIGNKYRTVGATLMNATSSRSHALFALHVQSLEGQDKIKSSKINLVDLAGSQRQSKTQASGDRLKEGAKINLSLTALGNVINALVQGKKGGHIPYRDSKLTRLLQTSLGGNTKTLMIASISPALFNYEESLSTLRYAGRARNIKNTPKVNEDPKDTLIKEYYQQIQRLKKQLQMSGGQDNMQQNVSQIKELAAQREEKLNKKQEELETMKNRLKQMEQLMLKKSDVSQDVIKKRRAKKKKIGKIEQIAHQRLKELQEKDQQILNDEEQTQIQSMNQKQKATYYEELASKLRNKLRRVIKDKEDRETQFEDERQDLNSTIRTFEQDLSFYSQVANKFLCPKDLNTIRQNSKLDIQKRQYELVPFLLNSDKSINLPKSLNVNQVDDLWKERTKNSKIQLFKSNQPEDNYLLQFAKTANNFTNHRKIIENYDSPLYQEKQYTAKDADQVIFRRTEFRFTSRSRSRSTSKNKILQGMRKDQSIQQNQPRRSVSKGKVKLQPIKK